MDCSLPVSSVHGIFQARNTGVGCHFLLQEIFPTQGLNSGLPHCRQMLYYLSHQGSSDFWATQEVSSCEYMSESKIARSYGKSMFTFIRNCQTVLQSVYHFAFSPAMNVSSCCFTSSPLFDMVRCLFVFFVGRGMDFNHSKRCVVVSHCLNMQFPNNIWCWALFICLFAICFIFFGETVQIFHLLLFICIIYLTSAIAVPESFYFLDCTNFIFLIVAT